MKSFRKHYGKASVITLITLVSLLVGFVLCMTPLLVEEAQAATYPTTTITLPTYSSGVLLTNPYFILYDVRTGYLIDATTGSPGAATTWANAALDSGHWTGGAVSTITGFPNLIIPPLDSKATYGLLMFDAASPAKTDTCVTKSLYNPRANLTYTDTSPTKRGEVLSRILK